MKWEIRGTKDGKQIRAKVSASSEASARAKAAASGVKELTVLPLADETTPAAAPAYAPATESAYAPAPEAAYAPADVGQPQEDAPQDYGQSAAYAPAKTPQSIDPATAGAQWPVASVAPTPVAYSMPADRDASFGLGLASVICGGVGSVAFCIWPVAFMLGTAGLGMGIAAWVIAKKRQSHIKLAVAGTIVSTVPFLLLALLAIGFATLIHTVGKRAQQAQQQAEAQRQVDIAADQVKQAQREAEDKARNAREAADRASRGKADAEQRAARDKAEADRRAALNVPIAVSADDLIKAYTENNVAADAAYKNHMVDVEGTIVTIHKNAIILTAGDKKRVDCNIAPGGANAILSLKTGQKVKVHGRCTGGSPRSVNVRDATITSQ